ncbi:MAG: hypothetical protein ACOY35_00490 [Bacillota bacterium]
MYSEIHQLKSMGFNKSQVARQTSLNVKTVNKYWEVGPDGFAENIQNSSRRKKLDPYHNVILSWLQQYPDMSASQVMDWLEEHYPEGQFRELSLKAQKYNIESAKPKA